MKKIKNILMKVAKIRNLKYIVVLIIGVVLIGFVGSNSLWAHYVYKHRINELRAEIDHYESVFRKGQAQIRQLQTNPKAMERIARERYYMKHNDEDIFVLSDDERTPQPKDPANETIE